MAEKVGNPILACYRYFFPVEAPPAPAKKTETHFIKFNIVDEKGAPLENITLNVMLPDGSSEEKTTDKNGKIEIHNIKPGKCKIEFEWKKLTLNNTVLLQS